MLRHLLVFSLFCVSTLSWAQGYKYNYLNYPVQFNQLNHGTPSQGGHGHTHKHTHKGQTTQVNGQGPFGGNSLMKNQLTKSVLRSLLTPATNPNPTSGISGNKSFSDQWNQEFGYNFLNIEAVQENVGCRAKCRRMDESPVCGDNMTRYFNSCDAECDQVKYNTVDLRYNKMCCCKENMMTLNSGSVFCVVPANWVKTVPPNMVVNECLLVCLQKKGDMIAQGSDMIVPC